MVFRGRSSLRSIGPSLRRYDMIEVIKFFVKPGMAAMAGIDRQKVRSNFSELKLITF